MPLISGTAALAFALVGATGSTISPAWYLCGIALVALPILLRWLPETFRRDIHANEHVT